MRTYRLGRLLLLFVIAVTSPEVSAQNANPAPSKQFTVGINVDSNWARITAFLPALRSSLLKDVPRRQKQVRTVAVDVPPASAIDTAKAKGCDYLLQLNVLEGSGPGVGASTFPLSADMSPEDARERSELAWVWIAYRLQSLKGNGLDVKDRDYIHYGEYPIGWDAMAFESTVIRATSRVAVETLNSLPKN